jgi:hypothetical protein
MSAEFEGGGRDMNLGPRELKAEVLSARPRCSERKTATFHEAVALL